MEETLTLSDKVSLELDGGDDEGDTEIELDIAVFVKARDTLVLRESVLDGAECVAVSDDDKVVDRLRC